MKACPIEIERDMLRQRSDMQGESIIKLQTRVKELELLVTRCRSWFERYVNWEKDLKVLLEVLKR